MTRLSASRRAMGLGVAGVLAVGVAIAVPGTAHAASPCDPSVYCVYLDANYVNEGYEGSTAVTDEPLNATVQSVINNTGFTITLHVDGSSVVIPPATTRNHVSYDVSTFSVG